MPLSEERPPLKALSSLDGGLLVATLVLAAIGLATVHSASSELAVDYLPRQAMWVAAGLVLMVVAMSIDYHTLLDFSLVFYLLGLAGLVLVLFVGVERGGAKSWFEIGPGQIQPSEFAKLATALFLARFLAGLNRRVRDLPQIGAAAGLVLAPMALIAVEPDLGGAAMLVPLLAGTLLVAGVRWRLLAIVAVLLLVVGLGVWNFGMQDYQRQRVVTFLQPESDPLGAGYQVRQSKIAVGSGQLTGKG
ncbi:MAG: FtsW/RodA/SpoVE family cell cycle protein, partial [Thermoanaerobaculia bacterium]